MKEIIVDNNVIDIEDIGSMEVAPRDNPIQLDRVRIHFKKGGYVDVVQNHPEEYIEEYFTSQKK